MVQISSAPRWLFEYAPWKRIVWSFIATICVAAVARKLFQALKIEHPIRPVRLCVLVLLAVPLLYVIAWMPVGAATLRHLDRAKADVTRWSSSGLASMYLFNQTPIRPTATVKVEPLGWRESGVALAWSFVAPFSNMPVIIRRYGSLSTTSPPVLTLRAELDSALPRSFVGQSSAWINDLAVEPLEVTQIRSPKEVWRQRLPFCRDVVTFIVTIVCSVATFVVLPFARSRAKVRWAQLGRCAAYLFVSVPVWLLVFSLVGLGEAAFLDPWGGAGHDLLFSARPILGVAVFLWLSTWWYSAVGRYLRMERPLAVALSVSTIGLLAGSMLLLSIEILVGS